MADLLLECFCEEIPADLQLEVSGELERLLLGCLDKYNLRYEGVKSYATPRRLVVMASGLDVHIRKVFEYRGPRVPASEQAIAGFLRSRNLPQDCLEKRMTSKGEFYFATMTEDKALVASLLKEILPREVLAKLTWKRSMRWGSHSLRWIRPLRKILCLFNDQVLPIQLAHITASDKTEGHRFMSGEVLSIRSVAEYENLLYEHYVMLGHRQRQELIAEQAQKIASQQGLVVSLNSGQLSELAGMAEWPVLFLCRIDKKFMGLPKEILQLSVEVTQQAIILLDEQQNIAPFFIVVANILPQDGGFKIISGNERVMSARLADADFFWQNDTSHDAEYYRQRLAKTVFHAKLGSFVEKIDRITALAKYVCVWIPHANILQVESAAKLAKIDLATSTVSEFPELQGIIGGHYARHIGEAEEVAEAVASHYAPAGSSDVSPTNPVTIAVSIADKADTLVGMFAIDEKPTGSSDPFGLRRAAVGVVKIILDNELRLPIKLLLSKAVNLYPKNLFKKKHVLPKRLLRIRKAPSDAEEDKEYKGEVLSELLDFLFDRVEAMLRAQNIVCMGAVFDDSYDILRLVGRARLLQDFLATPNGAKLVGAYRRIANILAEHNGDESGALQEDLIELEAEKAILQALDEAKQDLAKILKEDKLHEALEHLLPLCDELEIFFQNVMVHCEDIDKRKNRVHILNNIRALFDSVLNFDQLP